MKKCIRALVYLSIITLMSAACFDAKGRLPKYQGARAATILVHTVWPRESSIGTYETRQALVDNLVAVIYTNEGRRSLASWMHDRRPERRENNYAYGKGKNSILHIAAGDRFAVATLFGTVLSNMLGNARNDQAFNANFSQLVNLAFPCWAGTLTCYMHNPGQSLAKEALQLGDAELVNACKWFLGVGGILTNNLPRYIRAKARIKDDLNETHGNLVKALGILFALEIIDDWRQLQGIVGRNAAGAEPPPLADEYISPIVVPIPNTGYTVSRQYRSDCHFSTLKNLLLILCDRRYDLIRDEATRNYFVRKQDLAAHKECIAGYTNKEEHTAWSNALPENVRNSAEPSFYWLVYALLVLLRGGHDMSFTDWRLSLLNGGTDHIETLQRALDIIIAFEVNAEGSWNPHRMIITTPYRIRISIDGTLTGGTHVEITNIAGLNSEA